MAEGPLHVAMIGAGQSGTALLRALHGMARIQVVGVCDHDPRAPGVAAARELGIPHCTDLQEVVRDPRLDIIVQATSDPAVAAAIHRCKHDRAVVIEKQAMSMLLTLGKAQEALVRQLRAREHERDLILDSTHDGVLAVNSVGQVTICNRAAEQLLGVRREQVLGRMAREVIPGTRLHKVLRAGRPELNQQQDLGNTVVVTNRVPVRDEQGRIVGAVAVFRDITDVQALAEEITDLRETKALLEAIIHATSDAISVVDEQGIQILVNPAYESLSGLRREQVVGRPSTVDLEPGQESMLMRVLRTGQPVRKTPLQVGPHRRDVIVDCAPILVDGRLKGAVGVLRDVSEIRRLTAELERHKTLVRRLTSKYTFDDIVARSAVMQEAVQQARRAADTPATVLLRGESGTGKELFAHAIHNHSARREHPMVRVNCAAIPEPLLESELFGYEEGAFTGARKGGKPGLFVEAGGGTLFLDEIGDLPPGLQAKILRVLQEKEVRPVGGNRALPVDVRIIAATHANLEARMARGEFREDLYYRLNVLPIVIPPLRVRQEDIPDLAQRFLDHFNREYGRRVTAVADGALAQLMAYHWPGNVRELENVIGRAMIHMDLRDTVITAAHLPPLGPRPPAAVPGAAMTGGGAPGGVAVTGGAASPGGGAAADGAEGAGGAPPVAATATVPLAGTLAEVVAAAEQQAIRAALTATGGNKTEAARRLGIAPRTLYYKLDRYGIG